MVGIRSIRSGIQRWPAALIACCLFASALEAQHLAPGACPISGTVIPYAIYTSKYAITGTKVIEKTAYSVFIGNRTGRYTVAYVAIGSGATYTCSFAGVNKPPTSKGRPAPKTAAASTAPSGTAAAGAVFADINGDGIPDIAALAQDEGQVLVYLGNADGTFQNGVAYTVGTTPSSVAAADVNGDGIPDLAVTNSASNNVSVLLGKGDGTFRTAKNFPAGTAANSIAIGDFNGDGKPDLAIAAVGAFNAPGSLLLLAGNGDGTFQSASTLLSTGGLALVAADFNGDGKLDLALGQYDPTSGNTALAVLLGNGNGTFQKPISTNSGPNNPDFLGFADFNGDGKLDLAVSHVNSSSLTIFLGNGDGTFQTAATYDAGALPTNFSLLDFFGDGHLDIVVADLNSTDLLQILYGNGDGTFDAPLYYSIPKQTPTNVPVTNSIAVADFNGDGKPDLAATSLGENYVSVFLGEGGGQLGPGTNIPQPSSGNASMPAFVLAQDFNGDGKPDLALADQQSNSVSVLLGNGDGTFQTPLTFAAGDNPQYLAVGDFNGDGKPDLAAANSAAYTSGAAGNISILLGTGGGMFQQAVNYTAGTHPYAMVTGDFNGDGKLDLAVVNNGAPSASDYGGVSILLGNGDGTFHAATNFSVGQNPVHLATADINGDGKLDLVVPTNSSLGVGAIAVLLGKGNGTFQTPVLIATPNPPVWISILDVNGDGKPDLVDAEQGDMGYFQGNGDGTFQSEVFFAGGSAPSAIAAAAFNPADGNTDLAVADGAGGVSILLNQATSTATEPLEVFSSTPAPAGSGVAAASIASAYGTDLANVSPETGQSANLGGTTINVTDSSGTSRAATLFYVSQTQVNFLIPPGTANGAATVTVQSGDGTISQGTVQVNTVAPGIYTADSAGLAAALAVSYQPNGTYTYQLTAQLNAADQIVPDPISLTPQSNQVYLELYATGIRNAPAGSVTVRIGSLALTPAYAGAQNQYPGLDQIDVLLPYSLNGSGNVNVTVTVNGVAANPVNVTIQ